MMQGLTRIEQWIIATAAGVTLTFIAAMFVTTSWWFSLTGLHVSNAIAGRAPTIEYHRSFRRDFWGEWSVAVWRMERGVWTAYCAAGGQWPYKRSTPDPHRDLEWMVGGSARCSLLPPGTYHLEVTLTANPDTIISRSETINSNAFEILP